MRHILFLSVFIGLFWLRAGAQDTLILVTGNEILARIIEIQEEKIMYKKFENLEGPNYIISKDAVYRIIFENGTSEIITSKEKEPGWTSNENYFVKGQSDCIAYYSKYKGASTGTLVVSLLSPLVGLVPAVATSLTPPKDRNLDYPSTELFANQDYQNGYRSKAWNIKSRKVWRNWGIALGANVILFAIVQQ